MKIGSKDLSRDVYVIAEAGGNHNGSGDAALELVHRAADAGADAIKFQTYTATELVHPDLEAMPLAKAKFTKQIDRFRSLELTWQTYQQIIDACGEREIDFLSTPFDLGALETLAPHMNAIKVASGDATFTQLIRQAAATGKPVIVSTGMTNQDDVALIKSIVPAEQLVLLHCVSLYPTPDAEARLGAVSRLIDMHPEVVVGYSDHTIGLEAPLSAVAIGAKVIEKHFTLNKDQSLGDHRLSLEPEELKQMVESIRRITSMTAPAPDGRSEGEVGMQSMMRRGVYYKHPMKQGDIVTQDDFAFIRPPTAVTPLMAEQLVGKGLTRDVDGLEAVSIEDLVS